MGYQALPFQLCLVAVLCSSLFTLYDEVSGEKMDPERSVSSSLKSPNQASNSRGIIENFPVSSKPTVAIGSRSDALDMLTGGDLQTAAGEKKYMLVKKKPKHKKIKMEVFEPKMKYKKIKMKVPVKQMKKKKVKGYLVKKHHHHHEH